MFNLFCKVCKAKTKAASTALALHFGKWPLIPDKEL